MIRNVASLDFFTLLLIACIIFVAGAKLYAPKRFNDFISAAGNFKYLNIYSRDQKFLDKFEALLFINLIISCSIFILLAYNTVISPLTVTINIIFKLVVGVAVFILIKVLVERLVGSLFELDKLIDNYLFQKISYKNLLGLILLPVNIILIFSLKLTPTLVYIILGLIVTLNVIGLFSTFKKNQNIIKPNLFYFILYLCALEIAPYIIIYKVFK